MVRARACLLLVLAVLVTAPAATATLALKGESPVKGGWPFSPQVHCTFVFETRDTAHCNIYGAGKDINQLHARVQGDAVVTLAFADDARHEAEIPLGTIWDCRGNCITPFGFVTSPRLHLTVLAEGEPGSVVSVALERSSGTGL